MAMDDGRMKRIEEKVRKLGECLGRLSSFVMELASELSSSDDEGPADAQMDEVAAVRASQDGWRSEILDEKCPMCGSPRIRKTDLRTGEEFVGCSSFPSCRWRKRTSAIRSKVAAIVASTRRKVPPQDLTKIPF